MLGSENLAFGANLLRMKLPDYFVSYVCIVCTRYVKITVGSVGKNSYTRMLNTPAAGGAL